MASSADSGDKINITYEIDAFATNLPDGDNVLSVDEGHAISYGTSRQKITTALTQPGHCSEDGNDDRRWLQRVSSRDYHFFSNTTDLVDAATFDLRANIDWSREASEDYTSSEGSADEAAAAVFAARWVNALAAAARYNRSLTDHDDVRRAEGVSDETFLVSVGAARPAQECYAARAHASDGSVVVDGHEVEERSLGFDFDCQLPSGVIFCGQELCGLLDFESQFWSSACGRVEGNNKDGEAKERNSNSSKSSSFWHSSFWLFPLMIAGGLCVCWIICRGKRSSFLSWYVNNKSGNAGDQTPSLNEALLVEEDEHVGLT